MTRPIAFAGLAAICLPYSAAAQGLFNFDPAEGGLYAGVFSGGVFPGDARLDGGLNSTSGESVIQASTQASFDTAAVYGAFAGYRLPFKYWTYFQPRLELEISGFDSDLDSAQVNADRHTVSGRQATTFFLVNNYSDIVWQDNQKLVPFIGGGLGLARVDLSTGTTPPGDPTAVFQIEDEISALAGTFGGGLTYRASQAFEIYAEARYYTVYGAEFSQTVSDNGVTAFSGDVDDDLDGGQLLAGLRVRF